MTLWSPDTCGCKLLVDKDWESAEVVEKCPVHEKVEDGELFNQVYHNENKPRNMTRARLKEMGIEADVSIIGIDADRQVFISTPELSSAQKKEIIDSVKDIQIQ